MGSQFVLSDRRINNIILYSIIEDDSGVFLYNIKEHILGFYSRTSKEKYSLIKSLNLHNPYSNLDLLIFEWLVRIKSFKCIDSLFEFDLINKFDDQLLKYTFESACSDGNLDFSVLYKLIERMTDFEKLLNFVFELIKTNKKLFDIPIIGSNIKKRLYSILNEKYHKIEPKLELSTILDRFII